MLKYCEPPMLARLCIVCKAFYQIITKCKKLSMLKSLGCLRAAFIAHPLEPGDLIKNIPWMSSPTTLGRGVIEKAICCLQFNTPFYMTVFGSIDYKLAEVIRVVVIHRHKHKTFCSKTDAAFATLLDYFDFSVEKKSLRQKLSTIVSQT